MCFTLTNRTASHCFFLLSTRRSRIGRERGIILRRYLHANVVDMNVLQRKRPRSDLRMHRGTQSRGPAATISHNTARVQCKRKLKGQIHNWIETIGYSGADTRFTPLGLAFCLFRFSNTPPDDKGNPSITVTSVSLPPFVSHHGLF